MVFVEACEQAQAQNCADRPGWCENDMTHYVTCVTHSLVTMGSHTDSVEGCAHPSRCMSIRIQRYTTLKIFYGDF